MHWLRLVCYRTQQCTWCIFISLIKHVLSQEWGLIELNNTLSVFFISLIKHTLGRGLCFEQGQGLSNPGAPPGLPRYLSVPPPPPLPGGVSFGEMPFMKDLTGYNNKTRIKSQAYLFIIIASLDF